MASRRNLKKSVHYLTDLAAGICIIECNQAQNPEKKEALGNLFIETAKLKKEIISRISHTEPGNVKGFYKKLRHDFDTKLEEIYAKVIELTQE